jgi:hypothetical protein
MNPNCSKLIFEILMLRISYLIFFRSDQVFITLLNEVIDFSVLKEGRKIDDEHSNVSNDFHYLWFFIGNTDINAGNYSASQRVNDSQKKREEAAISLKSFTMWMLLTNIKGYSYHRPSCYTCHNCNVEEVIYKEDL